jgi:hypothetical protein
MCGCVSIVGFLHSWKAHQGVGSRRLVAAIGGSSSCVFVVQGLACWHRHRHTTHHTPNKASVAFVPIHYLLQMDHPPSG